MKGFDMSERMFTVIVRRHKLTNLVYPSLTGIKALATMSKLNARGHSTIARTAANGVVEDFDFGEMNDLFGRDPVEVPNCYLSTSSGKWRVIVRGSPICADKGTKAEALAAAAQMRVQPHSQMMWNGDEGEWVNPELDMSSIPACV